VARIEIGKHLAADTRVCGGRLIFKGSRIMVSDALEMAQAGYSPEKIAKQYRGIISPEDVREALSFVRRGIVREVASKIFCGSDKLI
jgi:uncharacterized protein (DUF433 family)